MLLVKLTFMKIPSHSCFFLENH